MYKNGKNVVARATKLNTHDVDKYESKSALDDTIIAAMEIVRKVMINGTDNIPPLDPFFIEQLFVDFESDQAK